MEQLKEKNPTCAELVKDKFNEVEQNYNNAQKYFDELNLLSSDDQEQYKTKDKYNEFFYCEDLFDYVNNSALSWDYVEAGTFSDQGQGYFRPPPSWGGFFCGVLKYITPNSGGNYVKKDL